MSEGFGCCPFCGGSAIRGESPVGSACWIECQECGCGTPICDSEGEAFLIWSRRFHAEIERLANYILSLDNGYPVAIKQYPSGMSAVDAAIMTIEAYRQRFGLAKIGH